MALNFEFKKDVDTVFNLLTDPDYLVERSMALGEQDAECEVEDYDDETVVKMVRRVRRELPSVLAKMFNAEQVLRMEETWRPDGKAWEGAYEISIDGQPVKISANFQLKPKGKGSVYSIEHRCKAKIPLVGGKVEKFILTQIEAGTRDEYEYACKSLGGR